MPGAGSNVVDEAQGAPAQGAQIWGEQQGACNGKITKKRVLIVGALAGAAALGLALFIGLDSSSGGSSARAVGQATDPAALGCFVDDRNSRALNMVGRLSDEALTPAVSCNSYISIVPCRGPAMHF